MPLTTRRKPAEPDWHAIRRALLKPSQRRAWNYLRGRLWEEVLEIEHEVKKLDESEYSLELIAKLGELIDTIPYLH